MEPKKTSVIRSVVLNTPTFHEVSFEPTLVNFFFGRNGTGKSTIAKEIAAHPEFSPDGLGERMGIMLFNQDYIRSNVLQLSAMPGILLLGKQDIEAEMRLSRMEGQRDALELQLYQLDQNRHIAESAWREEHKKFQHTCWKEVKDLRERYPLALAGFRRSSAALANEMELRYQRHRAGEAQVYDGLDGEQLDRLYHAAFDEHPQRFERWKEVRPGQIPECALLQRQILSSQNTAFGDFIQALGAANWVRDGHERFHERAKGKCPYCQQELPDHFEDRISECFDQRYEMDLAELRTFRIDYRTAGLSVWNQLKGNLRELFPATDLERYQECIAQLELCIRANLGVIDRKIASPEVPFALQDIYAIIDRANGLIEDTNEEIDEHNRRVAGQKEAQAECTDRVFDQMISRLHLSLEDEARKSAAVQKKRQEAEAERNELNRQHRQLLQEMETLRRQVGTSAEAAARINALLTANGYEGFALRQKPGRPGYYEAVRPDGLPAEHLSEGENGFLAFLYFYQSVLGMPADGAGQQERIVVIDDPVSGMDSSACAAIGNLTNRLAARCCGTGEAGEHGRIRQMFVLTHNLNYYKKATADLWRQYDSVSLYRVEKRENRSSLQLCVHQEGHAWVNEDPSQNSYLALWNGIVHAADPGQMVQGMQQILDRYMIGLCGFTQSNLEWVLEQNRELFLTEMPDGNLDQTEYALAAWILRGERPGPESLRRAQPEMLRNVFRKIFACLRQDQHYTRMMKRVRKNSEQSGMG